MGSPPMEMTPPVERTPPAEGYPEMQVLQGLGVSDGIAIGSAVVIETRVPDVFRFSLAEDQLDSEVVRLHDAVEHARGELMRTRTKAAETGGQELAAIFDAHILL